jgi:tRNA A37 threonylcarbamoyladenosine dehydratase
MSSERFLREEALFGPENMKKLKCSCVAVFGLGGVGSWAAEALARGGVGRRVLIDYDTVAETNVNRQIIALSSTIGRFKADVMAERAQDINPEIIAVPVRERYAAGTREAFFSESYDYIIDAIDLVSCKLDLIATALERGIPIISCLGTGNKLDGSKFSITHIAKTAHDPLARVVRKELRKRGISQHQVLWSPEEALSPSLTGEAPPEGRRSIPASVSWVPAAAGLMLAGYVIQSLLKTERY